MIKIPTPDPLRYNELTEVQLEQLGEYLDQFKYDLLMPGDLMKEGDVCFNTQENKYSRIHVVSGMLVGASFLICMRPQGDEDTQLEEPERKRVSEYDFFHPKDKMKWVWK